VTTGRGTMVERSPGVWRLRAYLGRDARQRPIQVSRTFRGGRRAAQEELARFVTEVADKGAPVTSGITVGELLDKWIDFVTPQREPGTIRGYTSHARRAKASLGHLKLTKLSAQHLDRAYAAWLAQGLSPTTVHHVHAVLSAALRQAVRWEVIPRAVTERAEPPTARPKPVKATDPRVVRDLIATAEGDEQPVLAVAVSLAAATGCRRGELCGLRWGDLDPAGVLHVRHALKHGLDGRAVELRDTKTHQERKIALDDFALTVLRAHRSQAEQWAADAGVTIQREGFILTFDPTGIGPLKPDALTRQFESLTKKVGVQLRFHDLRHFTATQLLGANVDPRTVAGRLGHSDPSITMRVYGGFLEERDREAAQIMGRLLGRTIDSGASQTADEVPQLAAFLYERLHGRAH
jgi:integrase